MIIEHRLEDVLYRNVDRVIVVNNGEIVRDTTPRELLATEILKECGIREPLYITALKYAGCKLDEDMNLENIDEINLHSLSKALKSWADGVVNEEVKESVEPLLELKNVNFEYSKNKKVLKDVSFKINKGEMVSIVGRNGAGKSTISRLICGFYHPTSGEILFEGNNLKNSTIKERAEKIGLVMQNPNQMISKTMIFDEVALGLQIRGVFRR